MVNALANEAPDRFAIGGPKKMSDVDMLIRLLSAALLGSVIGLERERILWAAGIRTHMLVCVGSCLIMIVSQYGFANVLTEKNVVLDPSRIAAQVVSGIGFLGAGSILARGEIVAQGSPDDVCRQACVRSLEDAFMELTANASSREGRQ